MTSGDERYLLSLPEAAKRLDICTKTLNRLIQARELPFIWIGKRRKIDSLDLERFIERQRQTAPEPTVTRRTASKKLPVYDFARERARRKKEKEAAQQKRDDR